MGEKDYVGDFVETLEGLSDDEGDQYTLLPPSFLIPDPDGQDRKDWESSEMLNHVDGIVSSAKKMIDGKPYGIRQPIIVRPTEHPREFVIVAGETRWRAATKAELQSVPVLIKRNAGVMELSLDRLTENFNRRGLSVMDLSRALQLRLDQGMERSELMKSCGNKSKAWLSKYLSPLSMDDRIQAMAEKGVVTNIDHMKVLNKLGEDKKEKAFKKIDKGHDPKKVIDELQKKKPQSKTSNNKDTDKDGNNFINISLQLTVEKAELLAKKLGISISQTDDIDQLESTIIAVLDEG